METLPVYGKINLGICEPPAAFNDLCLDPRMIGKLRLSFPKLANFISEMFRCPTFIIIRSEAETEAGAKTGPDLVSVESL